MEFTLGDESEKSKKKELSSAELNKQLDHLIQDKADNQRIFDWIEVCVLLSYRRDCFRFGLMHITYWLKTKPVSQKTDDFIF